MEKFKRGYGSTCINHQLLKMAAVRGGLWTRGRGHCSMPCGPGPLSQGEWSGSEGCAFAAISCLHLSPGPFLAPGVWWRTQTFTALWALKRKKKCQQWPIKNVLEKIFVIAGKCEIFRTSPIRNIQDIYGKANENLLKLIKEYHIYWK